MPTKEDALVELEHVFDMSVAEYREKGNSLPLDTTESRMFSARAD
jgi:hypothetical protein